jgi:hypothetical protein
VLAPSELLASSRKAALMTAPATLASTAPVKKFGVESVSAPPSVFSRPPVPVRMVVISVVPP